VRTSAGSQLAEAFISTGNIGALAASSAAWTRFGALVGRVGRVRGYGDFVHYHLLARGALDVVIESDVNILDIAAVTVIVREAGGVFTDLSGRPVGLDTTSVLATNTPLHAPVLQVLRS
jgi:histidinol-phosphatase